ncbi:hypothetical protein NP233_g1526 [Leucocoprinus birnbaumii]|uniref:MutL C-terminal dimerisation domain-containing protein n=1 Tax=Leucocoprinus birnbaumii TaxID=56174 RepID=A0AAD5W220_9AGAR|nr:hypothetical protein NP233_g1526 [Leucocoprinus birnbaumii]
MHVTPSRTSHAALSLVATIAQSRFSTHSAAYIPDSTRRLRHALCLFLIASTVVDESREPTQAKLRSTQILTTLPQIVSELLQNALDAQARHIDVGINYEDWMCWVRDDGSGISKQDIERFCAEHDSMRYRTSKDYVLESTNSVSTYGFRGEALASATQISCLEIASRSAKSQTTWCLIKKGDQLLYKGEAIRWRRESPGTVVCVRDAFYNLPVRRVSHPSASKTWELVRQEVELYALTSPSVAFTLEDLQKSREIGANNRTLRIPQTPSTLATFRHLYGRALAEQVETIDESFDENLKAQGFISLHGASSKIYQFLYINSHPITLCDLHRIIDIQFSSSNFGRNSLDDRSEGGGIRNSSRSSPRKNEKKPVYVLNIFIPPHEVDNGLHPDKNVVGLKNKTSVMSFLTHLTRGFLAKHGFMNAALGNSSLQTSNTALKRRRVVMGEDDDVNHGSYLTPVPNIGNLSLHPSSHGTQGIECTTALGRRAGLGESHLADTPCLEVDTPTPGAFDYPAPGFVERRTIPALTSKSRISIANSVPTWLRDALKVNTSYVLSEPPIPVNYTSLAHDPPITGYSANSLVQHSCQSTDLPPMISSQNSVSAFFSKGDLTLAKIIGQVDKKFIACLIGHTTSGDRPRTSASEPERNSVTSDETTLVLIDQHAADERVRVEDFLKELCLGFLSTCDKHLESTCGIRIKSLAPPKPILLTTHEMRLLNESTEVQEAFRSWGICFAGYSMPDPSTDNPTSNSDNLGLAQILVETIPDIVSDKLLQEDELQDLVKGFLAQLQTDLPSYSSLSGAASTQDTNQEFLWLKALRYCPRHLLDLINSKACRGAIMFNDTLTLGECESLVQRLALTAYPFQCAHGRPSLVPLIELGPQTGNLGQRRASPFDWSKLEVRG